MSAHATPPPRFWLSGKRHAEQDGALQAHRGLALVLRIAKIAPGLDVLRHRLVGHQTGCAPLVRHGIDFAINRGVGLDAVEQLCLHCIGVDLG